MGRLRALIWVLSGVIGWGASDRALADWDVRVRRENGRVQHVSLEPYVERSVAAEVYASWPAEALKAQAVAVRTYALHERRRNAEQPHDVESSVLSQRYREGGVAPPIREATRATAGQFLAYDDRPILAAFHASAGGQTAAAREVWGRDVPYLRSVRSPDDAAPDFFWSYEIPLPALLEAAGQARSTQPVEVLERSASGRVRRMALGGSTLSGRDLRRLIGGRAIRSTRFDVRVEGDWVQFLGSGAGHGVGLCQWGARGMALQGKTYRQILAHYYPGTSLRGLDAVDVAARAAGR